MITQSHLKELFIYNEKTGVFVRTVRRGNQIAGAQAGGRLSRKDGYMQIVVNGRYYSVHKLAWLYVYGEYPKGQLDHKNLNKRDNRICNLRPASGTLNCLNTNKRSHNTSGYKGVSRHGRGFRATITHDKKWRNLGVFDTATEAHRAYLKKAVELAGEFARG
jgi:hypothetical protein